MVNKNAPPPEYSRFLHDPRNPLESDLLSHAAILSRLGRGAGISGRAFWAEFFGHADTWRRADIWRRARTDIWCGAGTCWGTMGTSLLRERNERSCTGPTCDHELT